MKWILFTGTNCKNCAPMKNNLLKVGIAFDEVSTDTDNGKILARMFRISGLPSLAIVKDGKPVHTFPSGLLPIGKLEEIKKKYGVK